MTPPLKCMIDTGLVGCRWTRQLGPLAPKTSESNQSRRRPALSIRDHAFLKHPIGAAATEVPATTMPRKICIAVDNSRPSVNAFKWAIQTLVKPTDELLLVTVVAPSSKSSFVVGDHAVLLAEPAGPSEEDMHLATQVLEQCRNSAAEHGVNNVRMTRMAGILGRSSEVGNAIKHYAEESNADAIVVGSRGYGSAKRSVLNLVGLGSISDFLVRHSSVPVVVHKA